MLEQVLQYLNNWFRLPGGIHSGMFTIKNGGIALPFLKKGQYFRIVGSVFNDGVYQYPVDTLVDETFSGVIWSLAIPRQLLDVVSEVEAWNAKNGDKATGPYQSESFAGYSYTLKSGEGSNGYDHSTWQGAFSAKLEQWRKT